MEKAMDSREKPAKVSTGKKVGGAIGVVAAVVGIVAGLHEITQSEPTPSTTTNSPINVQMAPVQSVIRASVVAPPGYSSVYAFEYPSLTSTSLGTVADATSVQLQCSAQGDPVSSAFSSSGTSTLWYLTDYGYIPDSYLNTGTAQSQTSQC